MYQNYTHVGLKMGSDFSLWAGTPLQKIWLHLVFFKDMTWCALRIIYTLFHYLFTILYNNIVIIISFLVTIFNNFFYSRREKISILYWWVIILIKNFTFIFNFFSLCWVSYLHSFLSASTYRYVAYRQYTYWIHKKLGRKIRIAIPSCAVKKIRESFPSESGSYKGFEYGHWQIVNLYCNHQVCFTFMYCNLHNLYCTARAGINIHVPFRVKKLLFGNTLGITSQKWSLSGLLSFFFHNFVESF